jgi:thymidylate kinase
MDGSGKSTFIEHLESNFTDCDIRTRVVWHRPGSMPVMKFFLSIRRFFTNRKTVKLSEINNLTIHQAKKSDFLNLIWRSIYLVDVILFYVKIRTLLMRGEVVISDRIILDDIVDLEGLVGKPNVNRFYYWLIKKISPKPEIHYFIDTSTDIIRKRASSPIIEDLDLYNKLYEQAKSKFNINVIDNSKDFIPVYNTLSNSTLTKYFSKIPQKFSGYIVKSFLYK